MTTAAPRTTREPARRRRLGPLAITLIFVVAVVAVVAILAQTLTEVWWFDELGFGRVLWTQWGTQAALFAAGFVVMAGVLWATVSISHATAPVYAPLNLQDPRNQYREAFEPLRKGVTIVAPIVLGVFAGVAAASNWKVVQLWLHSQPFGQKDPQFHNDLSFYVFVLPGLSFVLGFITAVVVLSLVAGAFLQFVYGGIRFDQVGGRPRLRITVAARAQVSITAAVLLLVIAGHYWLGRYSTLMATNSIAQGADYTDVHAGIPAKAILAGVAVIVGLLFAAVARWGNWRLPAIGVALMVLTALVVGGAYPAVVARFQVQPNAQELEAPYIQRNIAATRTAYGLDDIDVQTYSAKTTAEAGALREDAETTASIRLLDPNIVSPAFRQLQQNKQYYDFASTLAVDKYTFGGQSHDTVIGVRELNLAGLGADQQNWVNQHTVFTHGYGVVAAYGNQVTSDGRPAFFESDIPSAGRLTDSFGADGYQSRIYFSPKSPDYSIVGAPEGSSPWELDYPDDSSEGQAKTTFPTASVTAGPSLGSPFSRLLYALRFQSEQILFSDRVTGDSQILYDRDPAERVQKVAPYLTLDGRVYPAVVDGKVVWIVDGYTTTASYPYSTSQTLDSATQDSLTQSSTTVDALQPAKVNYIRNSVKATVDAYDGSVNLYAWDEQDPVLKAWRAIFPATVKPLSEISGDLMSHIRYPEDLFKVQRTVLSKYHVANASDFFTAQDFWQVPADPTASGEGVKSAQPPYYVTLQMPGQDSSAFSLTTSFIPGGSSSREILTGFLAADADAGSTAGVRADGYGKLRLLVLPRNSTVSGPGQIQNQFNTDNAVAQALTYLKNGNATPTMGNLLTLPVGGGLLYVQPVYAKSSQSTQYPLLRYVLVAFGDKVGFATTLSDALDQVFGGDSGAETASGDGATDPDATPPATVDGSGDATGGSGSGDQVDGGTTPPSTGTGGGSGDEGSGSTGSGDGGTGKPGTTTAAQAQKDLNQALADMQQAVKDGDAALQKGDFAAYGTAQKALQTALDKALAAEKVLGQ